MSDQGSLSKVDEEDKENVAPKVQQYKIRASPRKNDSFLEDDSLLDDSCE